MSSEEFDALIKEVQCEMEAEAAAKRSAPPVTTRIAASSNGSLLKMGLFAALLFFLLGFGLKTYEAAPKHAIVLTDTVKGVYLAPLCVEVVRLDLAKTTIGEARKSGLKPDTACRDSGAFVHEGRSPSGLLLEWIGFLDPLKPRWNNDGTWNILPGDR